MHIRPATPDDAHQIAQVHVAAWRGGYVDIFPGPLLDAQSVEKRQAMWLRSIQAGKPKVLIAERDGAIAGFIAFGSCRDTGAVETDKEIWAINLAPEHWSKGIGRALMLAAREALLNEPCTRLSLWVVEQNLRARRFYEGLGLQEIKEARQPLRLGGFDGFEVQYIWQPGNAT